MVKVTNDLLLASDSGSLTILFLLDPSSAFHTVGHNLLLSRLKTIFGVSELALNWIKSYFTDRCHIVSLSRFQSEVGPVKYGVLQGSILGPLRFYNLHVSIWPIA